MFKAIIVIISISIGIYACSKKEQKPHNIDQNVVTSSDNSSKKNNLDHDTYVSITNNGDNVIFDLKTEQKRVSNEDSHSHSSVILSDKVYGVGVLFPIEEAHPIYDAKSQIIGLDFNNDKVPDKLTFCTSSEGEHFNAWAGKAYISERTAYSYRYINAELEADCKEVEFFGE